MIPPFSIRTAVQKDTDVIQRLFQEHLRSLGCPPDARLDADILGFPATYAAAPDLLLLATEPGGEVVGMAGLLRGEIRRVYVAPASRGAGVGRALVEALIRHAQAARCRELCAIIADDNDPSRRLFTGLGFATAGQRPPDPAAQHCRIYRQTLGPIPR
jgi:ribosomal protein S18 acetylase RimI-like enzyme